MGLRGANAHNGDMRRHPTRGFVFTILAGAAAVGGAAAAFLLGPLWAIAGVVAGPPLAMLVFSVVFACTVPDPVTHLTNKEPYRALTEVDRILPAWRDMAGKWPGQFREPLATQLLIRAEALHALHRGPQALQPSAEAVAIYRDLAARNPGKFTPGLAAALHRQANLLAANDREQEAIAAAEVAARLYRGLAGPERYLPYLADALLLMGGLLISQDRCLEAFRPLARGWKLATDTEQEDLLTDAAPAVKAACRADESVFRSVWRTETGADPPDWLTG
jgi:hypothetical protein